MKISSAFTGGRLTAYLSGELDQHEAKGAMDSLEELLDAYLPRDLVLGLGELKFMDSSGIALMIRLSRRMKNAGGRMWIENPGKQPKRVMDAAGIERLIPVAANSL